MSISRLLARPMLSSIFIAGGLDAVRHPENKVKAADVVVRPLVDKVPSLPQDTETLVKLNAAVQIGAGALLAVGRFRRLAALALIGSIIPTTFAGHRFWEETDDASRSQQLIHFLKNVGLLGGLVLAAVDTEGSPSLGWRARRRGRRVGAAAAASRAGGRAKVEKAADKVSHAAGQVSHAASRATSKVGGAADKVADKAGRVADKAGKKAAKAGKVADKAGKKAAKQTKVSANLASARVSANLGRAGDLLAKAHDRLPVG